MKGKRDTKIILGVINITLGIGILLLSIFAFIDFNNREHIFVSVFFLGGVMNLLTGVSHFLYRNKLASCFYGILGLALLVLSVLNFLNW